MIRLLLFFLLLVFLGALLRLLWLRYRPAPRELLIAAGAGTLLAFVLMLVATGRMHWIAAVLAGAVPLVFKLLGTLGLMRLLGGLGGSVGSGPQPLPGGGGTGRQQASEVKTRFLAMRLDHESGELRGEITDGPHAGTTLADLTLAEQIALFEHYRREDADSARLLETWLDRAHGSNWRSAGGGANGDRTPNGELNRQEALDILALDGTPDRSAIVTAHRRMMQKFHPDHGGSDYLAARINAAKDRLLRDLPTG